jgi:mono/diheme cytochrome c family protein
MAQTIRNQIFNTKKVIYLLLAVTAISSVVVSFRTDAFNGVPKDDKTVPPVVKEAAAEADSVISKKAFLQAYKVLMHPRCMNCHPVGDRPLQGDDSHIHTMNVQRGHDGKGLYAMKCSNCHQPQNTPGLHMPPGNPNWHLPPADMKMVFQGKTPRQLAMTMLNKNENGHKDYEALIEHVSKDSLVGSGWNPAEGMAHLPMTRAEFVKHFKTWLDKGAYLPDK